MMQPSPNPSSDPLPITVRVPVALKMLGLGRSKFYQLVREGEIEVIKVGRSTLVLVSSLQSFVELRQRT